MKYWLYDGYFHVLQTWYCCNIFQIFEMVMNESWINFWDCLGKLLLSCRNCFINSDSCSKFIWHRLNAISFNPTVCNGVNNFNWPGIGNCIGNSDSSPPIHDYINPFSFLEIEIDFSHIKSTSIVITSRSGFLWSSFVMVK